MNILYLTCHSILEQEEVKLLGDIGHNVISNGVYKLPSKPSEGGGADRPAITNGMKEFPEMLKYLPTKWGNDDPKTWYEKLDPKLVEWADIIMSMGLSGWFEKNPELLEKKKCVFRSIGQSWSAVEDSLAPMRKKGLKVLRYSPAEERIPHYAGSDGMIRFYKDANLYKGWNGQKKEIVTVVQSMKQRGDGCGWNVFNFATEGLPRHLYGRGNIPSEPWITGEIPFKRMLGIMRDARVFFYTGTAPAQYTLAFMEAWMTGTPIVAIGKPMSVHDQEVPELIENGKDGFVGNSIQELRSYCELLLEDEDYAKEMSRNGRAKACQIFDEDRIKDEWKTWIKGL